MCQNLAGSMIDHLYSLMQITSCVFNFLTLNHDCLIGDAVQIL